jgi:hypothetical protein
MSAGDDAAEACGWGSDHEVGCIGFGSQMLVSMV